MIPCDDAWGSTELMMVAPMVGSGGGQGDEDGSVSKEDEDQDDDEDESVDEGDGPAITSSILRRLSVDSTWHLLQSTDKAAGDEAARRRVWRENAVLLVQVHSLRGALCALSSWRL
jgi:hypothetical protein